MKLSPSVAAFVYCLTPIPLTATSITGTAAEGSTLTAVPGTWSSVGDVVITGNWQRDGVDIALATDLTYVLVAGDVGHAVTYHETGTYLGNTNTQDSNAITITALPVNTVAPAITGTATRGNTLTCAPGTWTGYPTPTITRQWKKGAAAITGETGLTYLTVVGDVASAITCVETATNIVGAVPQASNAITVT